VIDLVREALGENAAERMAIEHVAVPEEANQFVEMLRAELDRPEEIYTCELTPGFLVHSSPGMVDVEFASGS